MQRITRIILNYYLFHIFQSLCCLLQLMFFFPFVVSSWVITVLATQVILYVVAFLNILTIKLLLFIIIILTASYRVTQDLLSWRKTAVRFSQPNKLYSKSARRQSAVNNAIIFSSTCFLAFSCSEPNIGMRHTGYVSS